MLKIGLMALFKGFKERALGLLLLWLVSKEGLVGIRRWWLLVLLLPEFLNCSKMSSSLYLGKWGLGFGEPWRGECGEEEVDFLL